MPLHFQKKERICFIFALLFLFISRYLFYKEDAICVVNSWRFFAETVLFVLLYYLLYKQVKLSSFNLCLITGCILMGIIYWFTDSDKNSFSCCIPVSYLACFLFVENQITPEGEGIQSLPKGVLLFLKYFYGVLMLALTVLALIKNPEFYSGNTLYCLIMVLLVLFIYWFVYKAPLNVKIISKTGWQNQNVRAVKSSFSFAQFLIPIIGVYLVFSQNYMLSATMSILWVLNLLLLNTLGHPLVCSCQQNLRDKISAFFKAD